MSNPEGNAPHPERAAFKRLSGVVGEALSRLKELRERTEKAEAKSAELEELVRTVAGASVRSAVLDRNVSEQELH